LLEWGYSIISTMPSRVYLVDDDRFLLDLYAIKFRGAGYDTTALGSGEELLTALRKAGAPAPDAILIDILMPGMDGFETLKTVRKEQLAKGAKIIVLSNQGQDSDIEKAKELSVDGYIVKASAIPSEVLAETVRIMEAGAPQIH
jgi:CheY-like chemotaxis protein